MPTLTSAVTLESYIRQPTKKSTNHVSTAQPAYGISNPALYATPVLAGGPISGSSPPDSPSPYIVNRKRRQLPLPSAPPDHANGGTHQQLPDAAKGELAEELEKLEEEEDVAADFFDPRESTSVASSSSDTEERFGSHRHRSSSRRGGSESGRTDFYDATEDFFSDGSFPSSPFSYHISIERELQALKCNLIEEVERRKKAEVDLLQTHKQWEKMQECLSRLGFSYHETKNSGNVDVPDPAELCQAVIFTKFVSDAFERDLARAEAEEVSEAILDSKDHELSRLRDRLQYYEAMNHEMSQRNQEAVELARQQRLRRKTRRRLIWGFVGLSITFGASLLAYSYSSLSVKGPLPTSSPDASSRSMTTSVETEGCCSGD